MWGGSASTASAASDRYADSRGLDPSLKGCFEKRKNILALVAFVTKTMTVIRQTYSSPFFHRCRPTDCNVFRIPQAPPPPGQPAPPFPVLIQAARDDPAAAPRMEWALRYPAQIALAVAHARWCAMVTATLPQHQGLRPGAPAPLLRRVYV